MLLYSNKYLLRVTKPLSGPEGQFQVDWFVVWDWSSVVFSVVFRPILVPLPGPTPPPSSGPHPAERPLQPSPARHRRRRRPPLLGMSRRSPGGSGPLPSLHRCAAAPHPGPFEGNRHPGRHSQPTALPDHSPLPRFLCCYFRDFYFVKEIFFQMAQLYGGRRGPTHNTKFSGNCVGSLMNALVAFL